MVDEGLNALVPTQIKPGSIRQTPRLIKFGILAVPDDKTLEMLVKPEQQRARNTILKNAIEDIYQGGVVEKLKTNEAIMAELNDVLQDVALYAKRATFSCHH